MHVTIALYFLYEQFSRRYQTNLYLTGGAARCLHIAACRFHAAACPTNLFYRFLSRFPSRCNPCFQVSFLVDFRSVPGLEPVALAILLMRTGENTPGRCKKKANRCLFAAN